MEKKIQRETEIAALKEELVEAEADATNVGNAVAASADNSSIRNTNITAASTAAAEAEDDKELDKLEEPEPDNLANATTNRSFILATNVPANGTKKASGGVKMLNKMGSLFNANKGNMTNK